MNGISMGMAMSKIVDTLKELGYQYVHNTAWDYKKYDEVYSIYIVSQQVVYKNINTKIGETFTIDEMKVHLNNKIRKEKILKLIK